MDALSEVLRAVKLDSAFFHNAEFSAPWCLRSPQSCKLAPYINRSSGHVIVYHLLSEGKAIARLGEERLTILPGEVLIFPHGDSHSMESGPCSLPLDAEHELQRIFSQRLKVSRLGGGGEVTKFVCGFMVCAPELSQVFLNGLPAMFKVNIREESSGQWLEDSVLRSVADAQIDGEGGEAVLAKLSEVLFAETLRRYMSRLPDPYVGWLAGARDPVVGKVLALMHRNPATRWTLASLAREAGVSRSVLAERFKRFIGNPPLAYLTQWRLQLAAQMLASTSDSSDEISAKVGYESGQAFNRAFKRRFGKPPARFRNETKHG